MKPNLTVVKLGGNIIDHSEALNSFLVDFSAIQGYKILIHGGGKIASGMSSRMGITPVMIDGRRVTDSETLNLVTMVYAGLLNKKIVATLQSQHCNAIGLSGADGNLLATTRRSSHPVDYGFAGDADIPGVNINLLSNLLKSDLIPVICPVTHNKQGQLLNTNADTIASVIASAMHEAYYVKLLYCFEKNGVLADSMNEDSVINEFSENLFQTMKRNKAVHSGMLPKLQAGFNAKKNGVENVVICKADNLNNAACGSIAGTELVL